MNRHDAYKLERAKIESLLGYPVSVGDVAEMVRTAGKILDVLHKSEFVTFQEFKIILKLAEKSLDEITGGTE